MIDARRFVDRTLLCFDYRTASFCCIKWHVTAMLVTLVLTCVSSHNAVAQEASPPASTSPTDPPAASPPAASPPAASPGAAAKAQDDQSKLTEGLLELLGQPENEKSGPSKSTGPTADSARSKKPIQPKNTLGTGDSNTSGQSTPSKQGADLRSMGATDSNPLVVVRDNMHSAASMMQQGHSDQHTVKLQDEIVKGLDDLIMQLEQQDLSMQRSSQKKQQQSQTSTSEKQPPQAKPQTKQNQEKSDSSTEQGSEAADGPGSRGKQANANVRASDPAALQQSVWGHLPTRVRSQMQSRMVEEFLPSYRERIEAYYRALLEEGERK